MHEQVLKIVGGLVKPARVEYYTYKDNKASIARLSFRKGPKNDQIGFESIAWVLTKNGKEHGKTWKVTNWTKDLVKAKKEIKDTIDG